jgi:hypothetical protein
MKSLRVTVTGISALLMSAWKHVKAENAALQSPQEQAEALAYRTAKGELCVPGYNFQRALIAGAVYSKGKGKGTLKKNVAAGLFIREEEIGLGQKEFVVAMHRVVLKATSGAHIAYRPRIDSWTLVFTIDYDELLLNQTQIERILADTGARVGILAFRPEKCGPFGRFKVERVEPIKYKVS